MSELRACTVKIKTPNESIVKQTVAALAKQLQGEVVGEVLDYYEGEEYRRMGGRGVGGEHRRKVLAGVRHPVLCPGGYGVTIENGQVKIIGDEKFYNREYHTPSQLKLQQFQQRFLQTYSAILWQTALQKLGYATAQVHQAGKITIRGVKP